MGGRGEHTILTAVSSGLSVPCTLLLCPLSALSFKKLKTLSALSIRRAGFSIWTIRVQTPAAFSAVFCGTQLGIALGATGSNHLVVYSCRQLAVAFIQVFNVFFSSDADELLVTAIEVALPSERIHVKVVTSNPIKRCRSGLRLLC